MDSRVKSPEALHLNLNYKPESHLDPQQEFSGKYPVISGFLSFVKTLWVAIYSALTLIAWPLTLFFFLVFQLILLILIVVFVMGVVFVPDLVAIMMR